MTASYDELFLFIDGEWIDGTGRETSAVTNPATVPSSAMCHTRARKI